MVYCPTCGKFFSSQNTYQRHFLRAINCRENATSVGSTTRYINDDVINNNKSELSVSSSIHSVESLSSQEQSSQGCHISTESYISEDNITNNSNNSLVELLSSHFDIESSSDESRCSIFDLHPQQEFDDDGSIDEEDNVHNYLEDDNVDVRKPIHIVEANLLGFMIKFNLPLHTYSKFMNWTQLYQSTSYQFEKNVQF